MGYEVEVVELQPQPTLCRHSTTTQDAIVEVFDRDMPALWAAVQEHGYQPAGVPYARYHKWDEDGVEVEVGMPLAAPIEGEAPADMQAGELPGGRTVRTVHAGSYDGLGGAYEAIEAWLASNGEAGTGAPWESYVTDPGAQPDVSQWRTEVFRPLG